MATTTLLDNLFSCEKEEEEKNIHVTGENMCSILLDFSNDEQVRFEALELFYRLRGYEVVEILKKLVSVFCMSQTKLFQQFLMRICKYSSLPFSLRLETCKDICIYKDDDFELFSVLHELIQEIQAKNHTKNRNEEEITYVKELEAIMTLMRNNDFMSQSKQNMYGFLSKKKEMTCEYRYKSILSLQTYFDQRKRWLTKDEREKLDHIVNEYQLDFLLFFLHDQENDAGFRILSAQFLLSNREKFTTIIEKKDKTTVFVNDICKVLLAIGENEKNLYNIRADAIDVVLRYAEEDYKNRAKLVMMRLAKEGGNNKEMFTIYNNAQNAHTESIEKSAMETFQKLASYLFLSNFSATVFEHICEKLKPNLNENGNIALTRISLDNAVYGNLKLSLKSALFLVYKYIEQISDPDTKQFLFSRLYEELSESAGICSTGIFERMANTFTGVIDSLGIFISVEDQIMAVFNAKITSAIKNLVNKPCLHSSFCNCQDYVCNSGKFFINLFCKWENSDYFSINEATMFSIKLHETDVCRQCTFCNHRKKIRDKVKAHRIKQVDKTNANILCVHECQENENCNIVFAERLLEEMMIPVGQHNKRKTFLAFFRKFFPEIYMDMSNDFVGTREEPKLLDHTSFDLYIRKAVLHYVGEE